MNEVVVTLPEKWVRRIRSRYMWVFAALTPAIATGEPFILYMAADIFHPLAVLPFAVGLYLVLAFYIDLSFVVIGQVLGAEKG